MKTRILLTLCMFFFLLKPVSAAQSTITLADGSACLGDNRSKKQTEQAALSDAKKRAVEFASTYIKSETEVKNFTVEKDLLAAYAHAEVKIVEELDKAWYKDASSGDCFRVKIKAEVIPDVKAMETLSRNSPFADDPAAPLKIKAWTDKKEYQAGDKIRVYLRGNKPFYATVLYKDASGGTIQLLPNPYRKENYFNGGTIYEFPSGNDKFDLEVSPPFGEENVIVYAGSAALGEIDVQARGTVYQVKTNVRDLALKTRGVKLMDRAEEKGTAASEFFEDMVVVKTRK